MPGRIPADRIIAALEAVAREVHKAHLEHSPGAFFHVEVESSVPEFGPRDTSLPQLTNPDTVIAALGQLAAIVQESGATEARRHQDELKTALLPCLEPFRQAWSPLELMGLQHDERAWTQWLAHLLRQRENPSGEMAWRALCTTVEEAARCTPPKSPTFSRLADSRRWDVVKDEIPIKAIPEEPTIGGAVDIWVHLPGMHVVIENKLWESWHDGGKKSQADKYRDFAFSRAAKDDVVGLVFISVEPISKGERRPEWIFITWAAFARALRRELRRVLAEIDTEHLGVDAALGLYPVVLTLSGIETALLGMRRELITKESLGWRDLEPLRHLRNHLEKSQ